MAPARRALDKPIAIACLGLSTLCFSSFMCRISLATARWAFGPYLRDLPELERREREAVVARVRPRRLDLREDAVERLEAVDAERRLAVARRRVPADARRVRPRLRVVLEAAVRDERRLAVVREAAERRRPRLELERLLPVADLRAERDRDVALRVFAIGLASCRVRRLGNAPGVAPDCAAGEQRSCARSHIFACCCFAHSRCA